MRKNQTSGNAASVVPANRAQFNSGGGHIPPFGRPTSARRKQHSRGDRKFPDEGTTREHSSAPSVPEAIDSKGLRSYGNLQ